MGLEFTAEGDPPARSLDRIRHWLPIMLIRGEAEDISGKIEQRDIDAALPKLVAWAEAKTYREG